MVCNALISSLLGCIRETNGVGACMSSASIGSLDVQLYVFCCFAGGCSLYSSMSKPGCYFLPSEFEDRCRCWALLLLVLVLYWMLRLLRKRKGFAPKPDGSLTRSAFCKWKESFGGKTKGKCEASLLSSPPFWGKVRYVESWQGILGMTGTY